MKKFITQITLFVILLLAGYLLLLNLIPPKKNFYYGFSLSYMMGIRFKHERAASIEGPRIIFAGGSSLAYSLDSRMIENRFSVPVVNMGLHGGLGYRFIIEEARKIARKGDIVVFSIEYFLGEGDYRLIEQTCNLFPEVADLQWFSPRKEVQLHFDETRDGLKTLTGALNASPNSDTISGWEISNFLDPQTTFPFNHYGDYIEHLGKDGWYTRRFDQAKFGYRYWKGIQVLNEFSAEAKDKGISVFYTYAPYSKTAYDIESETIGKFHRDLANDLDIELLNTPEDFVFADRLFYDREYHLTEEGRALRTVRLLQFMAENKNLQRCIEQAVKAREQ